VLTIAGVAGSLYAFVGVIISFFTRDKVRPEADVQRAIEQGVTERLAARDAQAAHVTVHWPPVGNATVSPPATAQQAYTD
jgi:hypothetical protein